MKDKSLIPKGYYCYGGYGKNEKGNTVIKDVCPYHSYRDDKPEQENGYCSYLEKGDWELNDEVELVEVKGPNKGKTATAREFGLNASLLWDMCKMCNINEYSEEELNEEFGEE